MWIRFASILSAFFLASCVVTSTDRVSFLDPNPMIGAPQGGVVDASVLVLIPPDVKNYIWQGTVADSFEGSGRLKSIPFGQGLETGFDKACRQLFRTCKVVSAMPASPDFDAILAPRVSRYSFQWDDVPVSTYNLRVTGQLSLEVRSMTGGRPFTTRSYDKRATGEMVARVTYSPEEFAKADRSAAEKALAGIIQDVFSDLRADQTMAALPVVPRETTQAQRPVARQVPRPRASPVAAPPAAKFADAPLALSYRKGPSRPDDIAVVIGNADYGKLGHHIPDVVPAYADAASFKRYAQQALGIRAGNIIDLRDATGSQMTSVFGSPTNHRGKLFNWTKPNLSRIYVYYAGHGAPAGSDGSAYLVPTDADPATIELNGYPLSVLYDNLSKTPALSVTVILEACFSGATQGGAVISNASPVFLKVKSPRIPPNVTLLAAGGANQMASWEEDRSHGLFTKYYLTGMNGAADRSPYGNGDGRVDWPELKAYLDDTVSYYARRYYGRDQTVVIVPQRR